MLYDIPVLSELNPLKMASSSGAVNESVILTEDDIPGASLAERNPSSLKNEELRFCLRCRGEPLEGLKSKALLVKRYAQCIDFNSSLTVKVLKCGFVVCQDMLPVLGSSPDGRVVDFGCQDHFGVAEVKCPETKFHVKPLEACHNSNFFCEAVAGHCKLKRNHAYYAQVQGHMGISGASWCDFIVYTKKGISVERILFDVAFWIDHKQKLNSFYFTHFIKTASSEFAKQQC